MKITIVVLIIAIILCIGAIRMLANEVYATHVAVLDIQATIIEHLKSDLADLDALKEFGESMETASINRGEKLN